MDNTPEQVKSRPPYIAITYMILGGIVLAGSFGFMDAPLYQGYSNINMLGVGLCVLFGILYLYRMAVREKGPSTAPTYVLIGILAFAVEGMIIFPAIEKVSIQRRMVRNTALLHQVGLALRQYAADHEGSLPDAEHWRGAIVPKYYDGENLLNATGESSGYTFNEKLGGKRLDEIAPDVVLAYEARRFRIRSRKENPSVKERLIVNHSMDRFPVVYADGSCKMCNIKDAVKGLRWE